MLIGNKVQHNAAALRTALLGKKMVRFEAPQMDSIVPEVGHTIEEVRNLDKSIEIIPDYTYRNSFINESNLEVDENKIFMLDVNLVLFKKKINATKKVEFKFGINYTNGSDPTKGFDKQEITTYSFKLKI